MAHKRPGRPIVTSELVERFAKATRRDYVTFHCVLENSNFEDCFARMTLDRAKLGDDAEVIELAEILVELSRNQRLKLSNKIYEWMSSNGRDGV